MEEREIHVLLRERGQKVGERHEDGETYSPAIAIARPKQRDLPHDVSRRYPGRNLALDRLGDDEAYVMF